MVLQNKHKQAASRKYKASHPTAAGTSVSSPVAKPSPSEAYRAQPFSADATGSTTAEDLESDRPSATFSRRALGSNADRYKEEVEQEEEEGEPDEEEIERAALEETERQEFTNKQLEKIRLQASTEATQDEEDVDDVDYSFGKVAPTSKIYVAPPSSSSTSNGSGTYSNSVSAIEDASWASKIQVSTNKLRSKEVEAPVDLDDFLLEFS